MRLETKNISILKISSVTTRQFFIFLGVRHSNNVSDNQFKKLMEYWDEFVSSYKNESILFIEGTARVNSISYESSVMQDESSAAQWLARRDGVPCICPEPDNREQRIELCSLFDPQLVAYTMIVQNLASWFRYTKNSSFDEVVNKTIDREAKFFNIYGFVPTIDWFYMQHKNLFGIQKLDDKNFLDLVSDPRRNNCIINAVVMSRTTIRNKYLLLAIVNAWKSGKNIFVVYGKGHLDALEFSLKKALV